MFSENYFVILVTRFGELGEKRRRNPANGMILRASVASAEACGACGIVW